MKKNKTKKQMCTAGIIALILVAIDQLTKYLAVINLKQSSTGVFVLIPGVFEFRYLENQSAAFGVDLLSIIQNIFHFTYWCPCLCDALYRAVFRRLCRLKSPCSGTLWHLQEYRCNALLRGVQPCPLAC